MSTMTPGDLAPTSLRARPRDAGFSLTELLVVVLIIIVLAAIAIPVFTSQRQKSVQASVTADARAAAQEISAALAPYTRVTSQVGGYGHSPVSATNGALTRVNVTSATSLPTAPAYADVLLSRGNSITFRAAADLNPNGGNAGDNPGWCIEVTNGSVKAVANARGVHPNATNCWASGGVS